MPAPSSSKRPRPRPSTPAERGNRAAELEASEYNDVLRNGGREKTERKAKGGKVKKMAQGGKCRGMGAATRGGNYSRG